MQFSQSLYKLSRECVVGNRSVIEGPTADKNLQKENVKGNVQ